MRGQERVGIFWMSRDGQQLYIKSVPVEDADTVDGRTDYAVAHYDEWSRAIQSHVEWVDLEYDEVPRGRAVMISSPTRDQYVVYLPPVLKEFERLIASAFRLPLESSRFDYTDEHYSVD